MPNSRSVSFRAQTTGTISDLLAAEQTSSFALQELLVYLAGALLNYHDEGIEFSPNVVLCSGIDEFLQVFPGSVRYQIGTVPFELTSGPQILKDCAPLSGPKWSIYIDHKSSSLTYGVFSYFESPTALSLQDSITISSDTKAILVRRASPNTIEMRGSKGNVASFLFSTVLEPIDERPQIERFCTSCIANLKGENGEFHAYFSRLIERALTESHGTILVCTARKMSSIAELPDRTTVRRSSS